MEKICPKCGSSSKEKEFIGAFCTDCVKIKIEPPKKIDLYICKDCGLCRLNNKWSPFSLELIENEIKRQTIGNFDNMLLKIDKENQKAELKYIVLIEGNTIQIEKIIELKIHNDLCRDCSRMRGGYYEGIIQVRGENKNKIKRAVDKLKKIIEKDSFITKTVELKEGTDIYVGNKKKAIEIMSDLGHKFVRSRTLSGVKKTGLKKGMKQYRDTFLIRV
ncbi:60S ribosomal export protein NMD3 [Candidatus Micrarchaeota archaeon]|nr:60S ribosomal export protein NMD3 [Candidatus Micrarchaeota archaeon]